MTDKPEPELLPCPFCGGKAEWSNVAAEGVNMRIYCGYCEIDGPRANDKRQSAKMARLLWNNRVLPGK